ncbi:MAG: glycosyltransferase family 4 protein, partial [Terriglobia bacterium]
RLMRVPVVLSSQRSYRELVPPRYMPPLRISDRLANGIVVNCDAIRKHLVEDYSIPAGAIDTCYNAIDTDRFHSQTRQRPQSLQDASIVVGIVCVLRAIKNIETLVSAFAAASAGMPLARLVIVGDGPEKDMLRTLASTLDIADKVVFIPSTNDVAPWLRAIDVFVLPSTSEALSNSLMEAMASGCCAIASRVGGNPELIADGESGLLFEPRDAAGLAAQLKRVFDDADLRRRLADAGAKSIADRFSVERSIARLSEVYLRYLNKV